jgi:hypothetical protein
VSKLMTVPPSEWRSFFDRLSKGLLGKWVEIEVASLDLGGQITAEWIPTTSVTRGAYCEKCSVACAPESPPPTMESRRTELIDSRR